MRHVAILLRPLLAGTSTRVDVRVADGPNADAFALMGQAWEPAVSRRPSTSQELMSPDLDGKVQPGKATFEILMAAILAVQYPATLIWHGAPVTIYGEQNEQDLGATPEFTGTITSASFDDQYSSLSVTAEVSTAAFDVNFLKLDFDGSGGLGGDAAKRGTLKPAGMGVNKNCEPVWFDETRNIGMLDGYNNLISVQGLYEGRSSLGASVGDYASYALLAAAIDSHAVPPGRWATCIADGLVGLGAPPTGRVTADATFGTNRAGAMIRRILQTHCGISSGLIDTAAFNALDATANVNVPMHYWTADQRNAKDLIERIAGGCNATPIVNFQGQITITRGLGGANAGTLNRDGSTVPRVLDWRSAETDAPFWQLKARVARPGVVMTRDEINYEDTIVDRGVYNAGTVYRLGNLVWLDDKSSWLYTNPTASSGHAPPTSGAFPASNSWWFQQTPRLGALAQQDAVDWSDTTGVPYEQLNNNLLDMTAWKVGRSRNPLGAYDRFALNEATLGTNSLILDVGPYGLTEPMIRATSQAGDVGGGAGGWNYTYGNGPNEVLDPKQTYQLMTWIRMNSATNFYLGCQANNSGIKQLGGSVDPNPYHMVGPVPETGKWFLAVGVVHGHGYTGGQSGLSGLWDPATGRRVFEGVDFKFADATPTTLLHRTYQYYPAAAGKIASFARPRLDAANGNQPSIEALLSNARSGMGLRALYTGSAAPFPQIIGNRVRWSDTGVALGTGSWDAGAVGDVAADGACSVGGYIAVDRTVLMFGLTDQSAPTPHYSNLDYAIYCTDSNGTGLYLIYEDGSAPFTSGVVPAAGDFCFVAADDVVVRYYVRHQGGALTLLYTSLSSPKGKKLRPMVSLAWGGMDNIEFNVGTSNQFANIGGDDVPEANAGQGPNICVNGNAESGDTRGWRGSTSYASPGSTFGVSPTKKQSGEFSFLLHKANVAHARGMDNRAFAARPGDRFLIRLWYDSSAAVGSGIYFRMFGRTAMPTDGFVDNLNYSTSPVNFIDDFGGGNIGAALGANYQEWDWTVPGTWTGCVCAGLQVINYTNGPQDLYFEVQIVPQAPGTQLVSPITGRVIDGRTLNASNNFGIRSLAASTTLTDTDTSGTVTINITAATYYGDWGGSVTYPSGSLTGKAYNTRYYVWRNVGDDPTSAGTSYGSSTSIMDALGSGKVYLGNFLTRPNGATPPPPPPPPPGGGSNCVDANAWVWLEALDAFKPAWMIRPGDRIACMNADRSGRSVETVQAMRLTHEESVRLTTESGCELILSAETPMELSDGSSCLAREVLGREVPCGTIAQPFFWDRVVACDQVGMRVVARISANGCTYAAGTEWDGLIYSHNVDKP